MKNSDRGLLLQALMLSAGAMVLIAGSSVSAAEKHDRLVEQTVKVRAEKISAAESILAEAKELRKEKQYEQAEVNLTRLMAEISSKNSSVSGEVGAQLQQDILAELKLLRDEWAVQLMSLAYNAAKEKRYTDAMLFAADAAVKNPELEAEVSVFTENCNRSQRSKDFKSETSTESSIDNYAESKKSIDTLMREGHTFFANGKYNDARLRYERVFLINPYDSAAISALSKVYEKLYRAGSQRMRADVAGMVTNNVWTWSEPIFSSDLGTVAPKETIRKDLSEDSIYARMDKIIIPEFTFTNFNIQKAVNKLEEMTKVADPDKRGIGIALSVPSDVAKNTNITMNFLQIPLSDLIRYLCLETGLKVRIDTDGDGITLGTSDAEMISARVNIRGDLISSIAASEGEDAAAATTADVEFGVANAPESVTSSNIDPETLKDYFSKRGITFEEGATISYHRKIGCLYVTNTAANIRRLEELVRELDSIETPLVLVEIKLVEITENDWQELGFQWNFDMSDATSGSSTWSLTQSSDPVTSSDSGYKLVDGLQILPTFGKGLIKGVDMNLSLSIDAISRNDRTDVLSAPKLLTRKGSGTASISLNYEYYFPSDWDEASIESDDNGLTFTSPIPDWDDSTEIGIDLSLTADVEPDNYTITLELHPSVTAFIGQSDDTTTVTEVIESNGNTYTNIYTYNVWMPITSTRKADLTAKIYDGETIVIGGMVDNQTDMVRDKWPILGDLPLLGRLFSGESTTIVRRNLMIFVTARLVNNDGIPIRQGLNRSIPDFNR